MEKVLARRDAGEQRLLVRSGQQEARGAFARAERTQGRLSVDIVDASGVLTQPGIQHRLQSCDRQYAVPRADEELQLFAAAKADDRRALPTIGAPSPSSSSRRTAVISAFASQPVTRRWMASQRWAGLRRFSSSTSA